MNTRCVSGCLDVDAPIRVSFMKLYQWPQSDAEFVKLIAMKDKSSSGTTSDDQLPRRSHEGYASRQMYLRSYYTFSKRETVAEKTRKWLVERKKKKKKKKKVAVSTMEMVKMVKDKSVSGVCCAFEGVFVCLLYCMVRVDVVGM